MVGAWISGLRKARRLDQRQLAARAGISIDQVSRLERGENVGVWYLAAVVVALKEQEPLAEGGDGLLASLAAGGSKIRSEHVLSKRIKDHDVAVASRAGFAKTREVGAKSEASAEFRSTDVRRTRKDPALGHRRSAGAKQHRRA